MLAGSNSQSPVSSDEEQLDQSPSPNLSLVLYNPAVEPLGHPEEVEINEVEAVESYYQRFQYGFTFYAVTVLPRLLPVINVNRPWWSTIIDGLKVGAIPIENWDHGFELLNECNLSGKKLGLVVSCCESFELAGNGLMRLTPVSPAFWIKHGVTHLQIKMPDFKGGVPLEQIHLTVAEMHRSLLNGESVYVHCKAGRGRSIVMIACYLIEHQNMSPDDAIALIRQHRAEVSLSRAQFDFIEAYRAAYKPYLPPLYSQASQQLVQAASNSQSTAPWYIRTVWYVFTYLRPTTLTDHFHGLQHILSQDFRSILNQWNTAQQRALHAGLTNQPAYTTDLVYYYPLYEAGRKAREQQIPEIEELTETLEKKLTI